MAEYTSQNKQGNGSSVGDGLTDAASHAAAGLMAQMKTRASSQVAAQQAKAADGLGTVASALRKAGNELRTRNEGLASYADMAVDELEHISTRIREKSPGEYVSDLEHFARSRPAAFVGGTFLLGLGLARFLKSTQPRRPPASSHYANEQESYRSYPGQREYRAQERLGYAGQDRGYDAPGGSRRATGRWPESTGQVTPPAPSGRTPMSASNMAGTTGAPRTSSVTREMGTSSDTLSETNTQDATISPASARAGKPAASRGRERGEPS